MSVETLPILEKPALPRVNLLPPEIAEAQHFRRLQLIMGAAVVGAVAVVGGLTVHAHSSVAAQQDALDAANARQATLQSQVNKLTFVTQTYSQVSEARAMLTQAMGDEIQWSHYLNDLSLRLPDNVWLTNLQATESEAGAAKGSPQAARTTVAANGIGSITFSGTALSYDDVASLLEALAAEHGFTNAYFTNSTESKIGDKTVVNFTSSATLTSDALSGRFTKPAGS